MKKIIVLLMVLLLCLQGNTVALGSFATQPANNVNVSDAFTKASKKKVTKVKLNKTKTTVTLKKGDEGGRALQLKATITPKNATNKMLNWKSSNPSVADVDDSGLVTIYREGKANIKATSTDGSKKSSTCVITVKRTYVISISLPATATIEIGNGEQLGKKLQLSGRTNPSDAFDGTLSWKSTDETIATVDQNGLLTSTGYGKVKIEVSTTGSKSSGMMVSCAVTVKKAAGATDPEPQPENPQPQKPQIAFAVSSSYAISKLILWIDLENRGKLPLYVYSKGAMLDMMYTSSSPYDRLTMCTDILGPLPPFPDYFVIAPGQRKTVYCYVDGKPTLYSPLYSVMVNYINYDGVKYVTFANYYDGAFYSTDIPASTVLPNIKSLMRSALAKKGMFPQMESLTQYKP